MSFVIPLFFAVILAQETPVSSPRALEELINQALSRSPEIEASAARARAAAAGAPASGAIENPMLELMLEQEEPSSVHAQGEDPRWMISPRLIQPLPFPGVRGARRQVARLDAERLAAETEVVRRRIVRDVRGLYASIYALDAERRSIAAAGELVELVAATVRQRYAPGAGGQSALIELQLRESRLRERDADLAAERARFVAGLDRLVGGGLDHPFGDLAALPDPSPPDTGWEGLVAAAAPDLVVRRTAAAQAESELRLTRVEGRPDLSASAGMSFRSDMEPLYSFGVGVGLPIWNGQNRAPRVRAAHEALLAARAEVKDGEARLREEVAQIAAEWGRAHDQLARYDAEIIPRTRLAFDAARAAYLSGEGEFAPLVTALSDWLDARAGRARREADRFIAWASYQALISAPDRAPSRREGGK